MASDKPRPRQVFGRTLTVRIIAGMVVWSYYVRLGVPRSQAEDLASEEVNQQGPRYDYQRGPTGFDFSAFARRFSSPGQPVIGYNRRRWHDGTEIVEPLYR
jgi:hypothetical protein